MNIEHIQTLSKRVESGHNVLVATAHRFARGRCMWPEVADAIRSEGEAIVRLADAFPSEQEPPDPDQAREDARIAQWASR